LEFEHLLPAVQPQFFLERTRTGSEQSLAQLYTILLDENVQVRDVGGRNLFLALVSETDQWLNDIQMLLRWPGKMKFTSMLSKP
jgi:hypothetical protein